MQAGSGDFGDETVPSELDDETGAALAAATVLDVVAW